MTVSQRHEIVALSTVQLSPEHTATLTSAHDATIYVHHPAERDSRPYSTMVRVPFENDPQSALAELATLADVGLYRTTTRVIKALEGAPAADRCIASFGLVRNPDLNHDECDAHWRDVHGPLALRMHLAMCDYVQVSIDEIISGLSLDGIALCAFESRDDLSNKFFNDDEAKAAIIADVATFSAPHKSPARVVLRQLI